ncbi:MAG TPA: penicillin-binding protein [Anaeromyxobacter sp.]|nr:penicillin-binding protein [Anaeromyxobacter sp.]
MRPGPDARAGRWIAIRVGVLAAAFAAGFAAVAWRVFDLQVVDRDRLVSDMVEQYRRQLVLKPRRGPVTDRAGVLLAGSADAQSVYADPAVLAREDGAGAALRNVARALGLDPAAVRRKLAKGTRFVWIARRVSPQEAAAVERVVKDARLRGIALVPETRRYYPRVELASALLGWVGDDGNGLEGVELALDDVLSGAPARVPSLRDGAGRTVLAGAPSAGRDREGARVELTIDQGLQLAAERALARAVSGSRALSGMAIAIDPRTGEILAMASAPGFNPNAPRRGTEMRNRAVADSFEPGSTMKTFAVAGALDRGAVRPLDPIDCGDGSLAIGAHVIHDHAAFGWVGPAKVLAVSSNVGAARIAARLGRQGLQETLLAFGFGERTGVGLPGEVRGQVPFPRSDIALATQSFGHGLTGTALQVTAAMGAIANGGVLVRPTVVKRIVDPATGEVLDEARPEVVRRAVSAETATTVARWLVGVVEDPRGTGTRARLDGWRVAGKTGTAQKADAVSGGYSADRHFSSFVGFAPADAPRIVVGVFVDEPRGEIHGGEVAAPAFREVAEYAMKMLGVPPTAGALAAAAADASPPPPEEAEGPPPVEQAARAAPPGSVAVPALAGLPARAAVRALEALDLSADLAGSGRVVRQSPPPGRVVARGTRVRMTLQPAG